MKKSWGLRKRRGKNFQKSGLAPSAKPQGLPGSIPRTFRRWRSGRRGGEIQEGDNPFVLLEKQEQGGPRLGARLGLELAVELFGSLTFNRAIKNGLFSVLDPRAVGDLIIFHKFPVGFIQPA